MPAIRLGTFSSSNYEFAVDFDLFCLARYQICGGPSSTLPLLFTYHHHVDFSRTFLAPCPVLVESLSPRFALFLVTALMLEQPVLLVAAPGSDELLMYAGE